MRPASLLLAAALLFTLGCAKEARQMKETLKAVDGKPEHGGGPANPEVPRKIVYTAQVDLVVDDFEHAAEALKQLVEEQKGYLAKSEVHGSPGIPRSANWTVRVPVDHFQAFMDAVARLGELRRSSTDSDDITDKYYDLRAHLKTNQVEEQGLQKLYLEKAASSKLPDLLPVRRELRDIRGEIEAQQGQLARWNKETQFATVIVSLQDRKDYVAPTSPKFGTSIARTFRASVEALVDLGKAIVLVAVALVPWLPLPALVLVLGRLWLRRRRKPVAGGSAPRP